MSSHRNDLIYKKRLLQERIFPALSHYILKYHKSIKSISMDEQPGSRIKALQKKLLRISKWSNEKKKEEFNRFLKWCEKKYGYEPESFKADMSQYLMLTLQIIAYNTVNNSVLRQFYTIDMHIPFYKCIRSASRDVYDKIRQQSSDDDIFPNPSHNDVSLQQTCLIQFQKCIFIDKFLQHLNEDEQSNYMRYDYEDVMDDDKTIDLDRQKVNSRKEQEENNTLPYISSDEFDNEYYKSDDEKNNDIIDERVINFAK